MTCGQSCRRLTNDGTMLLVAGDASAGELTVESATAGGSGDAVGFPVGFGPVRMTLAAAGNLVGLGAYRRGHRGPQRQRQQRHRGPLITSAETGIGAIRN